MGKIDFSIARMKHLAWKSMLRGFLDGKASITEDQAVSHQDCELGKWLYADGLKKYGTIPEMKTLEKEHVNLHETVKRVIELKHAGSASAADAELKKLDNVSRKVMDLLTAVEQKVS